MIIHNVYIVIIPLSMSACCAINPTSPSPPYTCEGHETLNFDLDLRYRGQTVTKCSRGIICPCPSSLLSMSYVEILSFCYIEILIIVNTH